MSDLNKAVLKVAQQNPEFAKLLQAELGKTAVAQKTEYWLDPDGQVEVVFLLFSGMNPRDFQKAFDAVDTRANWVHKQLTSWDKSQDDKAKLKPNQPRESSSAGLPVPRAGEAPRITSVVKVSGNAKSLPKALADLKIKHKRV